MPASALPHISPSECIQVQTFEQIQATLRRLDAHGERTAVALEQIAQQGAMVAGHEKRLDKHDKDFQELFSRVNDPTWKERTEQRVTALELKLAKDEGAEEVVEKHEKFWTEVRLKLVTPIVTVAFLALWLADRTGTITKLVALWREFNGG
jgi:uncharacterized coiled-coil protein SlyX